MKSIDATTTLQRNEAISKPDGRDPEDPVF
jgi:hypothetical protein